MTSLQYDKTTQDVRVESCLGAFSCYLFLRRRLIRNQMRDVQRTYHARRQLTDSSLDRQLFARSDPKSSTVWIVATDARSLHTVYHYMSNNNSSTLQSHTYQSP